VINTGKVIRDTAVDINTAVDALSNVWKNHIRTSPHRARRECAHAPPHSQQPQAQKRQDQKDNIVDFTKSLNRVHLDLQ